MTSVLRSLRMGNKEVDQNKLNSYKPKDKVDIFDNLRLKPRKVKHVKTKMALAIAAFVIGLLLIAAAILYNQGLLQQGINALGGNLSTVANEKAFAVAVAAGALTTTIGLLSIIYLSKKIHETRKPNVSMKPHVIAALPTNNDSESEFDTLDSDS